MTAPNPNPNPCPVGGWGVPAPLYVDTAEPFPVDALPPVLHDICEMLVREINGAHINLVAPTALGILNKDTDRALTLLSELETALRQR